MQFFNHLSQATILDRARGLLAEPDSRAADEHTATCQRCADQVEWARAVYGIASTDDLEDAPSHVIARAVRLVRPLQPAAGQSLRRRLIGALQFDSALSGAPAGARAGAVQARQTVFEAGEFTVEVRTEPRGHAFVVSGQVLGTSDGGDALLSSPEQPQVTSLNEVCEFEFAPVRPGRYTLSLRLRDVDVDVPNLVLA
jgi:anti-sigma factor RsiW